ncbi:hypothetical protein ACFPVX_06405 [Cohnella faecalis]|uniref:Uncharacterized protein n=1 Tax=Cohnella faecalis TaxID=2315694 RepID=A0A398CLG6_9BACL|nr:hypothetical protein [Cohnella faecalis]RIE02029.1 hypothetical protein D3H35_14795 [Cohnella faecalis]
MKLQLTKNLIKVGLAGTLVFGSVTVSGVSSSFAATAVKSAIPAPLTIAKNVTAQVKNVELFTQDKGLYLVYTINYVNNGASTLQLDDYWAKIKTTSGKSFSIKVVDKDKKITTVAPKSNASITYYAAIDEGLTLKNLRVNLIKWDFNVAGYMKNIGTFDLAKGYAPAVAAYEPITIAAKETKLKTSIKTVQSSVDDEDRVIDISYVIENLNTREYKAATTQFYVMTPDGSIYSAVNSDLKDLVVKPKERKTISLKATLPIDVKATGLKLITGYQSEADGIFIPTAAYQVPKASEVVTNVVTKMTYDNYNIEILGYSRLPSGSQDALQANIKVTNISNDEQKVPSLKASWKINGVAQETKTPALIAVDSKLQLSKGESIQLAATIFIPYTLTLKDVSINLKEVVDEKTEETIGSFRSDKYNVYKTAVDSTAAFTRVGSKSNVELLKVRSKDDGKQVNIFGDLAVTNLEYRPNSLQKYGIYLKGKDGQIYPLAVGEYEGQVISSGRIIVPFTGKVPLAAKDNVMDLLITELLPNTGDASNKDNTVSSEIYSVTAEWTDSAPSTKFHNLAIGKYDFTFDKFYAYLDMSNYVSANGLKLDFEYTMVEDSNVDDMAGTYKLRFELEDQESAKVTFVKEFALNGKDKTDEFASSGTIKKTIQFNDPAILDKITNFQEYKLSIYYTINDQKVLLAQKTIPYFYIQWMNL